MRPRARLLAAWLALATTFARAQPYPGVTPLPRTTDRAVLRARATDREIVERMRLGLAALDADDPERARLDFARVLDLHPREPQASTAFYDLGVAEARLGQNDLAAADFRRAIARDRAFLAARANLVAVLLAAGDLDAARPAADDLLAIAPESARALYARGIVALRAGDAATASLDFRKLLANDPHYAVAHYDLALAERKLGDLVAAEREVRAALALVPSYARASIALGAILLREGKRDDARTAFDDAVRTASDASLRNLARSFRDAIVR
ncbi:MAG: hypothetical protein NVS3B16_26600 [Vulcanimicrobiaceae bacterium]